MVTDMLSGGAQASGDRQLTQPNQMSVEGLDLTLTKNPIYTHKTGTAQ